LFSLGLVRAFAIILGGSLVVSCSGLHVVGAYRASLSPADIAQITALAQRYRQPGDLRTIEAVARDKAKVEFYQSLLVTAGGGVFPDKTYTRFYVVKQHGEWRPVKKRDGQIKIEIERSG
jgi:hypothetical protein